MVGPLNGEFNLIYTVTDLTNTGTWDYLYDFGDSTTSVEVNPEHTYGYWDFGDGSASTSENPTYTYYEAGSFVVRLLVQGAGGTDEFTRIVESYQTPNSYFDVIPKLVYVDDEEVKCLNLSEYADSWVWEFGDGDTSHIFEPNHKYMEEGVFDVTLHSYTDEGCSDTYILSPAVTVEPLGGLLRIPRSLTSVRAPGFSITPSYSDFSSGYEFLSPTPSFHRSIVLSFSLIVQKK